MSESARIKNDDIVNCYQQAQAFLQGVLPNQLVLNTAVFSHWIEDSDCFWYAKRLRNGRGTEYRLVNAETATNTIAFNHELVANMLAISSGKPCNPQQLPISNLQMTLSTQQLRFTAFNKRWLFDCDNSSCEEIKFDSNGGVTSPDGTKVVFVHDHSLWIKDLTTQEEHALTHDGTSEYYYASPPQLYGAPVISDLQVVWSPDSRMLLTYQFDVREVITTPYMQSVPQDESLRPQVAEHKIVYPGDAQKETFRLVAIDVIARTLIPAKYGPLTPSCARSGFFTYEKFGWWDSDSQRAYFVDVGRGAHAVQVVEWDTFTGATRPLFKESSETYIKLSHCLLGIDEAPLIVPLVESNELIWFSERSGWAHLYLYDLNTGELKQSITGGKLSAQSGGNTWNVRNLLHVDIERRELLIQTSGRDDTISPYYRDICRVHIDTGELLPLINDNYEHVVFNANSIQVMALRAFGLDWEGVGGVSPSGQYVVTTRSRVDEVPISLLIDRNGREVLTVETADLFGLPEHWEWPEPVKVKSADGHTNLYGVVYRPPNFSQDDSYPVLDLSCANPAFSLVPHASFFSGAFFGSAYLDGLAYAALGFVVVALEVPGMPNRDRSFRDMAYGRYASTDAFEDRIAGIHQLAEKYEYMDIDRVGLVGVDGITGPVYGLLEHPEFYKVGVMVNLQDTRFQIASVSETVEGIFAAESAAPFAEHLAGNLQGKLLLIHGMMDICTPLVSTLRLVEALREANKDFDLLLLPHDGHQVSTYALRRTWDYIVKHLQGTDPPVSFPLITAMDLL